MIEKKIEEKLTIDLLAFIAEPVTIASQKGNPLGIIFLSHFKNIENLLSSLFRVVLIRKIQPVTYNLQKLTK